MNMDSDDNAHVHMDNRVLCMLMGNNYLHYSQGGAVGLSFCFVTLESTEISIFGSVNESE